MNYDIEDQVDYEVDEQIKKVQQKQAKEVKSAPKPKGPPPEYYVAPKGDNSTLTSGYFNMQKNAYADPESGRVPFYANNTFFAILMSMFLLLVGAASWDSLVFTVDGVRFLDFINIIINNEALDSWKLFLLFSFFSLVLISPVLYAIDNYRHGKEVAQGKFFLIIAAFFGQLVYVSEVSMDMDIFYLIPIEVFGLLFVAIFYAKANLLNRLRDGNIFYIKFAILATTIILASKSVYILSGGEEAVGIYFFLLAIAPTIVQQSVLVGTSNQNDTNSFPDGVGQNDITSLLVLGPAIYFAGLGMLEWILFSMYTVYVVSNLHSRTRYNEILTRVIILLSSAFLAITLAETSYYNIYEYLQEGDAILYNVGFFALYTFGALSMAVNSAKPKNFIMKQIAKADDKAVAKRSGSRLMDYLKMVAGHILILAIISAF